jgi:hypothetical protein
MRISCRRSCRYLHKLLFHIAHEEPAARAGVGAAAACRLHAWVRRHRACKLTALTLEPSLREPGAVDPTS